jgi:hypothetical protein
MLQRLLAAFCHSRNIPWQFKGSYIWAHKTWKQWTRIYFHKILRSSRRNSNGNWSIWAWIPEPVYHLAFKNYNSKNRLWIAQSKFRAKFSTKKNDWTLESRSWTHGWLQWLQTKSRGFLQRQKVIDSYRVKESQYLMKTDCHFNSFFVLKTPKTPVFVFITEILWQIFWRDNSRSLFDVVKNFS